jgi:hypothetical protein
MGGKTPQQPGIKRLKIILSVISASLKIKSTGSFIRVTSSWHHPVLHQYNSINHFSKFEGLPHSGVHQFQK